METIGYGIDVSHYQTPARVRALKGQIDFVIVKACEGGRYLDSSAVEHVRVAREIGAKVGLYIFFRHDQTPLSQFDAFRVMSDRCGIREGDIAPAIDIEALQDQPVTPGWSGAAEELTSKLVVYYGDALVYLTQREWKMLGGPQWVLDRPLWTAHYISAEKPATPGGLQATIWQHRSAPFLVDGPADSQPKNPLSIDQNRLLQPLPLIGAPPAAITDADRERISGLVALTIDEELREPEPENTKKLV